jgi:hypothetical protein
MKSKNIKSAECVLETLEGLSVRTTIRVLAKAIEIVMDRSSNERQLSGIVSTITSPHGNAGRSKFLMDHEVRNFIASYNHKAINFLTIDRLRYAICEVFGASRTPSRTALGRFLKAQRDSSRMTVSLAEVENVN